jgi:hypothetical protein
MWKTVIKIGKWVAGIVLGLVLLITILLYAFKDKICGVVIAEVNTYLKVPVSVSDVDLAFWGSFPNLSVDFNNVYIQSAYDHASKHDTLLYSERIRLKFNPLDLWNKNYHVKAIEISPGTLQLKINKKGEVNYDIFKPSDSTTTSEKFDLKLQEIDIDNVRFTYYNRLTGQLYKTKFIESTLSGDFSASKYSVIAEGNAVVLKAKSGEVTLLSNKTLDYNLSVNVDQEKGIVSLPKALINIAGLPFEIDGKVDPDSLNFRIQSKDILLTDLVNKFSLDAAEDVKKFKGDGTIDFDLGIHGKLETTEPTTILCDFGIENGSLTEPYQGLKISNINVAGKYSNEGGAEEEFLELRKVHFRTAGGPFNGDIRVTEFVNPRVEGKANGNVDLNIAHAIFKFPEVEKVSGAVRVNTDFAIKSQTEVGSVDVEKCDGDVIMKNVWVKLLDDKRTFEKINGSVFLRGDEAGIQNTTLKVGSTDLKVNGLFSNIYDYFKGLSPLQTEVDIESNFIKIEDLGSSSKQEKIEEERFFVLPNDIRGSVQLTVGNLQYEKHRFSNILGRMNIQNQRLHFPQISLVNADALVSGAIIIEEKSPEIFTITAQVASKNLKFKPLFKEWDNFEQNVLTDQNISGRAEAELYFTAPFDLRSGIGMKAINAKLDLRVYDGQLKNVSSFKDITSSLKSSSGKLVMGKKNIDFLEQKLSSISFKTMENSILIHDGKIEIPKMHISSSALDMDVAGTHTFDNEIDYRFAFRFRDLMLNERDKEFGIVEDDGTGIIMYLRMYGTIDKPIFEWDNASRKEQAKQNREEAKQDAKSILKSEFGLFQKDTSVKMYVPKDLPKEDLKIQFGPSTKEEFIEEKEKKQKKDSKLKNTLNNWKKQQEEEDKTGFKVGKGGG